MLMVLIYDELLEFLRCYRIAAIGRLTQLFLDQLQVNFLLDHSSPPCLQFGVEGEDPFDGVCGFIWCYQHVAAEMMVQFVEI
jgi:hypothetical protein